MSEMFTILKSYRIFQGNPSGKPAGEMNEDQLYGWLRLRGCSEEEATALIEKLEVVNAIKLHL